MSELQVRCHSDVYGGGQVCPTTTTLPKFNGVDCGPAYGGGYNPACLAPPVTVVVVPSTGPKPSTPSDLPFTGGDIVGLTMLGIGMLSAGIALIRSGRRKASGAAA